VSQKPEVSADAKKTGNYIEINSERCKGCYLCITACPQELIEKSSSLNASGCYPVQPTEMALYKCTACGLCWQMCPDVAIEVFKAAKEAEA
jgi:2-oxoglutarate ferredoxin oxidoreductase subunit delta